MVSISFQSNSKPSDFPRPNQFRFASDMLDAPAVHCGSVQTLLPEGRPHRVSNGGPAVGAHAGGAASGSRPQFPFQDAVDAPTLLRRTRQCSNLVMVFLPAVDEARGTRLDGAFGRTGGAGVKALRGDPERKKTAPLGAKFSLRYGGKRLDTLRHRTGAQRPHRGASLRPPMLPKRGRNCQRAATPVPNIPRSRAHAASAGPWPEAVPYSRENDELRQAVIGFISSGGSWGPAVVASAATIASGRRPNASSVRRDAHQ